MALRERVEERPADPSNTSDGLLHFFVKQLSSELFCRKSVLWLAPPKAHRNPVRLDVTQPVEPYLNSGEVEQNKKEFTSKGNI